jgi:putative membrane protein
MAKNWLLSLHLVAVISWMAGVLYLYRLIVYHAEEKEQVVRARFEVMERRLWRGITVPAMIAAVCAGAGMIALDTSYYAHQRWLWAKLALALCLIWSTLYAGRSVRRLREGKRVRSERHFRMMNELPTLLMIGIILLVILKPF